MGTCNPLSTNWNTKDYTVTTEYSQQQLLMVNEFSCRQPTSRQYYYFTAVNVIT